MRFINHVAHRRDCEGHGEKAEGSRGPGRWSAASEKHERSVVKVERSVINQRCRRGGAKADVWNEETNNVMMHQLVYIGRRNAWECSGETGRWSAWSAVYGK